MTNGTHVVVVLDANGRWADVLGPFPTRAEAVTLRRRIVKQIETRPGYYGLDAAAVVVSPLLAADAYEQARADIAATTARTPAFRTRGRRQRSVA